MERIIIHFDTTSTDSFFFFYLVLDFPFPTGNWERGFDAFFKNSPFSRETSLREDITVFPRSPVTVESAIVASINDTSVLPPPPKVVAHMRSHDMRAAVPQLFKPSGQVPGREADILDKCRSGCWGRASMDVLEALVSGVSTVA